ncbi:Plasmodium exported protein, unknown function [Plasmodium knowlesi strain H]|uniref:Plasmodium RESA N-terminal domain-containing protein n=3 Tax=Plasmodium knowlesi TaxID=5850 RepID=A0A5K1VNM5_PLAKH|nr:Plasmodium exported protein (PHIST), unknown function [Plasmodium knowlesi strain H]OTN68283.1 Uncharacterized protein PKNOH_S03315400 [Plasmodium knowlesi]CAA9987057.1 Plasmodium exported protein (PHIST), unknown function [Plasmodium knowlesi strain H]SBO23775.1 Plasmodium exported protein, unknown function [Plasmodium knowlesi strain H]SBO25497.1 Plasmodium exported protein, unknown function [Plasmodium knowlesi strain H]VVS76531.1 Plasmodium exported protein (PHIST), unknown function [Pl|eukprot:XP_002261680.1 hypothetical protein, conserved in Plasmodium species [Plasmodium knowlesi strain H]
MVMKGAISDPLFRVNIPKFYIREVDNSIEMTNEPANCGNRERSNRCETSLFRILNIVFIGLLFLEVETTVSTRYGETHGEATKWTNREGRRLACQSSSKASHEVEGPMMTEENANIFDSTLRTHNNLNDNSSQDIYGLSQLLCKYNKCFIRSWKKEGKSVDFADEGGSSADIPSICWEDETSLSSSSKSLEGAYEEIERRRNRFVKKGYFEHMNHTHELSETEFIEKISNLGDYVDPEEMSSIFYYVHTNERKKYFLMQENVITHWENLCYNYNVKENFKEEQMRNLYEETTNFFLFKEKHFLKSFSTFVRLGRYSTKKFTDGLISYKRLWKEYRRIVNNFCHAKLDEVLRAYWEENKDRTFQMRIQY